MLAVINSTMRNNCKIWKLFSLALKLFSRKIQDSALLDSANSVIYVTLSNSTITLELAQVLLYFFKIISIRTSFN